MDASDVGTAVDEAVELLRPLASMDWAVRAGELEWSCWTTAAHIAHDLLAYAGQVAACPSDGYLPLDLRIRREATPDQVLDIISAAGTLLSAVVAAARPQDHAWHFGLSDASGFAAMGVGEVLVHTYDIATGLGVGWTPPSPLSAGVLARLMPEAPSGDPSEVLLWSTGRVAFEGVPRVTSWVWKAAAT